MGTNPGQCVRRQTFHQSGKGLVPCIQIGEQIQQVCQRMDVFHNQRRLLFGAVRLKQPFQKLLIGAGCPMASP